MKTYAVIGSVSHGTMRNQDLIPAFIEALQNICYWMQRADWKKERPEETEWRKGETGRIIREIGEIESRLTGDTTYAIEIDLEYIMSEESDHDLVTLIDLLNHYAPPYCYFGANEGDGSDYGFWVDYYRIDDDSKEGQLLSISDKFDWPEDEIRERLENDCITYILVTHSDGGETLYTPDHEEVWNTR